MHSFRRFSRLGWLGAIALAFATGARSAEPNAVASGERIAIAIVFDTSGSMKQAIASKRGGAAEPKIVAARRAFHAVIDRLDAFTHSASAKPVSVGIYVFEKKKAIVARAIAPFAAPELRRWVDAVSSEASTPLGDAIFLAGRDLLATEATSRHLLVLSDGENTEGRQPGPALAQVLAAATKKQIPLFTHVIAFGIKPAVFAPLQKQGATLIGAADGEQLRAQFDFILEEKILVEAPR